MPGNSREYWLCVIGPTNGTQLPSDADIPMHMLVKTGFEKMTGHKPDMCSTGWGITEQQKDQILEIRERKTSESESQEPKGQPDKSILTVFEEHIHD